MSATTSRESVCRLGQCCPVEWRGKMRLGGGSGGFCEAEKVEWPSISKDTVSRGGKGQLAHVQASELV